MRIVMGDDITLTITVKTDGTAVDISSATTVTVALLDDADDTVALSGEAASGATGADWTNGVIVIPFTAAETATLTAGMALYAEVEVDNSGISSWVRDDITPNTFHVKASAL